MATNNWLRTTTIQAGEDLNSHSFRAVALDDGKIANNGEEATGILQNKPKDGEFATLGYVGEMKFIAGAAITAGDKLTVVTSGFITTADSSDVIVGENKTTVTSGSFGTGIFSFPSASQVSRQGNYAVTAADTIIAGIAYTVDDDKMANNGAEFSGIAAAAITSGDVGEIVAFGITKGRSGPELTAGNAITVSTSGYLTVVTSGDYKVGQALTDSTSGALVDVVVSPSAYQAV